MSQAGWGRQEIGINPHGYAMHGFGQPGRAIAKAKTIRRWSGKCRCCGLAVQSSRTRSVQQPLATKLMMDSGIRSPNPSSPPLAWQRLLLQFSGAFTQHATSNNELLNLLRAFEDVENLGIARPLLQQLIFAIA